MGGGDIGDGFGNGHAARGGGVEQSQRRAFAHGHGRAGIAFEGVGGQGYVGQWHLIGADQLIAGDVAGDGAIGDGDEKGFVGHGGEAQDAFYGIV